MSRNVIQIQKPARLCKESVGIFRMKGMILGIKAVTILLLGLGATAITVTPTSVKAEGTNWDLTTSNEVNYFGNRPRVMTSAFRVVPAIGYGVFDITGLKAQGSSLPNAGLLLQYGRQSLQFESGFVFMNIVANESLAQGTSAPLRVNYDLSYVGIPLIVKYAFLTKPNSSFFFKAGAMPLILANHSSSTSSDSGSGSFFGAAPTDSSNSGLDDSYSGVDQVSTQSLIDEANVTRTPRSFNTMGVVGIGGTANIGESRSLLLDITGYHSFESAFETDMGGEASMIKGVSLMLGMAFGY